MGALTAGEIYTWDHAETAHRYDVFAARHDRYSWANRILVELAQLGGARRVLDFAAGTGLTASAALSRLPAEAEVVCVEPSAAMRAAGERRLPEPRIQWKATLREGAAPFDRILCGAAIWQMLPVRDTLFKLASYLQDGGALCFNVPSLYLGIADQPGGGRDPHLINLPALLTGSCSVQPEVPEPYDLPLIDDILAGLGLRAERSSFRYRLTQECLRDWLKIPMLTNRLMPDLDSETRALRIDEAFARVDANSWKWEEWTVWVAWKTQAR